MGQSSQCRRPCAEELIQLYGDTIVILDGLILAAVILTLWRGNSMMPNRPEPELIRGMNI